MKDIKKIRIKIMNYLRRDRVKDTILFIVMIMAFLQLIRLSL